MGLLSQNGTNDRKNLQDGQVTNDTPPFELHNSLFFKTVEITPKILTIDDF